MKINQRLEEIEKTIDAIGIILAFLINPIKEVDQDFLGKTIKDLKEMIKNQDREK
jgi:hypothetical protein